MDNFKSFVCRFITLIWISSSVTNLSAKNENYISTAGNDQNGTGTEGNPWCTITHALDNIDDESTILVKPGTYSGRIRLRGTFPIGVTIRSEVPYKAILRHSGAVITAARLSNNATSCRK